LTWGDVRQTYRRELNTCRIGAGSCCGTTCATWTRTLRRARRPELPAVLDFGPRFPSFLRFLLPLPLCLSFLQTRFFPTSYIRGSFSNYALVGFSITARSSSRIPPPYFSFERSAGGCQPGLQSRPTAFHRRARDLRFRREVDSGRTAHSSLTVSPR